MRGDYCVFEAWELMLKKQNPTLSQVKTISVYHYFIKILITTLSYRRINKRPEGTVYVLPKVPPSTLQYCPGTPNAYQLNQLGVVKRFVLKTLDNTAKATLRSPQQRCRCRSPLPKTSSRMKVPIYPTRPLGRQLKHQTLLMPFFPSWWSLFLTRS